MTVNLSGQAHTFGGDWTSRKLDVLSKYLKAYTRALKDKPSSARPFFKTYVDAFAGTGYRSPQRASADLQPPIFDSEIVDAAPPELLDGSAKLALKVEPRFDNYLFIERSADRCVQLEGLRAEFPHLAKDVEIQQGDANTRIRTLCSGDWKSRRAVLFLDPYGMQVDWETIAAIASTKAIDLWLLFPLGIGVNRLLTRSGEIPTGWRLKLDRMLGRTDWYDEFYRVEQVPTLFDEPTERMVKATQETIGRYFNERLRSVFPGVAEPGVLKNSANCPLYLLCFAASNENGAPIALRIAKDLLKGLR